MYRVYSYTLFVRADMAELADALDLGSSGHPRAGSSPVIRIGPFYAGKRAIGKYPVALF